MQSAQSQQPKTSNYGESFYLQLYQECKDLEKNFDSIKDKFSQIKEINIYDYVEICRCAEALIQWCKDQRKCISLLNYFPWSRNEKSFQQIRVIFPILHSAVMCMKFEIVDYLIRVRRVNPNAVNNIGERPLHIAAENGSLQQSLDMTEFLLKRGADPRIVAKILPHHPRGSRVIDYWPERSRFKSHTELGKASLAILDQAEALLDEYTKNWDKGKVAILPLMPEQEEAISKQELQKETLVECASKFNFGQRLFSFKHLRDGYSPISEEKENYRP